MEHFICSLSCYVWPDQCTSPATKYEVPRHKLLLSTHIILLSIKCCNAFSHDIPFIHRNNDLSIDRTLHKTEAKKDPFKVKLTYFLTQNIHPYEYHNKRNKCVTEKIGHVR